MKSKSRVVFDTNALISAVILPQSISAKAFEIALANAEIIVSDQTWFEFVTRVRKPKLERYFESSAVRHGLVEQISMTVAYISVTTTVADCRDPDDNKFLALALDGAAQVIVSGDADLQALHPWQDVQILSPRDFVCSFDTAAK